MVSITPTVGRIVWFVPRGSEPDLQPLAAIVTYVHNDRLVNLAWFSADGHSYRAENTILVQEGDDKPDADYCKWMPYQIGQAKKHSEDKPNG